MRKTLLLTLVLVFPALWLQAQAVNPGADTQQAPGNTSGATTINGCLQSSGGHYTVTEKDGTVHNLIGDIARLSRYVGQQVEITGTPTVKTIGTTMINSASSAEEIPAFRVKSAKEISKTCSY